MSSDDEDVVAIGALRRLRAAVRAGVSPKRREELPKRRSADRDPALLGDAVRDFLTDHHLEARHALARVLEDWPNLVGSDVAHHVSVEGFDEGTLALRADSTTWANQMRLLSATIQRRLDEELGEGFVERITVIGPDAPSWRFGRRRVAGRGPRDTYG